TSTPIITMTHDLALENVLGHRTIMRGQIGGKLTGAITARDKIQEVVLLGMKSRVQGRTSAVGNGSGRQAAAGICVPRRVRCQVALAYPTLIVVTHAINNGWVGLQGHANTQAIDKHAAHPLSVRAMPGLFLDYGGEDKCFVRRLER